MSHEDLGKMFGIELEQAPSTKQIPSHRNRPAAQAAEAGVRPQKVIQPGTQAEIAAAHEAVGAPPEVAAAKAEAQVQRAKELAGEAEPGPFQAGGTFGADERGGPSKPFGVVFRNDPPEIGNYHKETIGKPAPKAKRQPLLSNLLDRIVGRSFTNKGAKPVMEEFRSRYLDALGEGQSTAVKWEGGLKTWARSIPEEKLAEIDAPQLRTKNAKSTPYRLRDFGDQQAPAVAQEADPLFDWAKESGRHIQSKEPGQRAFVDVSTDPNTPEVVAGVQLFRAKGELPQAIHPEVAATIQARPTDPQVKAFRDATVELTVEIKKQSIPKGDPKAGEKLAALQAKTEDAADKMISTLSELKDVNEIEQRIATEFQRSLYLPDQFRYKDQWIDGTVHRLLSPSKSKPGYIDTVPRKLAMQSAWDEKFGQNLGQIDPRALEKYAKENPTAPLPKNKDTILGQYRDYMGKAGLDPTELDRLMAATQHETQTFLGHSVGTLPNIKKPRTLPIDTPLGRLSYAANNLGRDVVSLGSSSMSALGAAISNVYQALQGTSGMVRGGAARGIGQTIREGVAGLKEAASGKELIAANLSSNNTVRKWSLVNAAGNELMTKGKIEAWSQKLSEWGGRNYSYRVGAMNSMRAGQAEFENMLRFAKEGSLDKYREGLTRSVGMSDRWMADMNDLAIVGDDNPWGQLLKEGLKREFLGSYVRNSTWYGQQAAFKKPIQFGGWKQIFNPFIDPAAQIWSRTEQIMNDIYRNPKSLDSWARGAKFGSGAAVGAYLTAVSRQAFLELSGMENLTASEKRKSQSFVEKVNHYALWQIFAGGPVADVIEGTINKGPSGAIKDAFTPLYAKMAGDAVGSVVPHDGHDYAKTLLTKLILPMVVGKTVPGEMGLVARSAYLAYLAANPEQQGVKEETRKLRSADPAKPKGGLYPVGKGSGKIYKPIDFDQKPKSINKGYAPIDF